MTPEEALRAAKAVDEIVPAGPACVNQNTLKLVGRLDAENALAHAGISRQDAKAIVREMREALNIVKQKWARHFKQVAKDALERELV